MNKLHTALLTLFFTSIISVPVYAKKGCSKPCALRPRISPLNSRECKLHLTLHKLWADHVIWMRSVIASSIARLGDVEAAKQRLLQNQVDIGNAIAPFYGQQAGAQLAQLLQQHELIAGDIVKALMNNNKPLADTLNQQWHANAVDIATLLSTLNPNWNRQDFINMLYQHLQLATQAVMYRLQGNWQADVANFDQLFSYAQTMADSMANGIVKQFPNRF